MTRRNTLIAAIVAVLMLAAVPFLSAAPGHRGRGDQGPGFHAGFGAGMLFGHLKQIREELDLSEAQTEQIRTIFADLHKQNEAYREELRGGFHAVAQTLLQNPNDLAGAQALLDRQAAAEKTMKANALAATSRALNVLTADQRAELAQMIKERGERRAQRRNRR